MSTFVKGTYYDGVTSRPWEAGVRVDVTNTLEVEVDGARFHWPLAHAGMQWERNARQLRLTFGEHPRKVLLVEDELFISSFVERMRSVGRHGVHDRLMGVARKGPVLFFVLVLVFMGAAYVWLLPWATERLVLLAPTSLDEKLGDAAFGQMSLGMDEDTARSARLQAFGDRLALSPSFPLTYHVVNEDQVNAFALPGGHIVVHTGILNAMDSSGELAALLAHEGTHVEERHSTRMMARSLSSYLFISLLVGDVSALMGVVAENADKVRNLGYGRALESEADAQGMERMAAAGVDPHGMVALLHLLEREAQDMPEGLSFLSSHPLTTERIAAAEEKAKALRRTGSPDAELERLFQALKEPK